MKEAAENRLTSKEVEKELKISSCDLAHLRVAGKLDFTKRGNTFLYMKRSVLKVKNNK
jgi:hypothetical protein